MGQVTQETAQLIYQDMLDQGVEIGGPRKAAAAPGSFITIIISFLSSLFSGMGACQPTPVKVHQMVTQPTRLQLWSMKDQARQTLRDYGQPVSLRRQLVQSTLNVSSSQAATPERSAALYAENNPSQ